MPISALGLLFFINRHPARILSPFLQTKPGQTGFRLVAGAADLLIYYLVLLAMQLSYVSYVGSVREMSVVLGAFLGSTLLREGYGRIRLLASALVFLGILLIGVAG